MLVHTIKRLPQHVFACVLLHVIASSRPIHLTRDPRAKHGPITFECMPDAPVVILERFHDPRTRQNTRVARLPARRRVERRFLESDICAVISLSGLEDGAGELSLIGIEAVQARGHRQREHISRLTRDDAFTIIAQ
jgi:hypothetical protein